MVKKRTFFLQKIDLNKKYIRMNNEWYIQIFSVGQNKKEKEVYNIIENKTINKQEIGIGFCDNNPILLNNKMIDINNLSHLSKGQNLYRKRMFEYFINTMKIGDTIYLKKGKEILYKATIASDFATIILMILNILMHQD